MPVEQFRKNHHFILNGLIPLVTLANNEGFNNLPIDRVNFVTQLEHDTVTIVMTQVLNNVYQSPDGLSRIERAARQQVPIIIDFLHQYVPGFEHANLISTSHQIGIRESRHIEGDYVLTKKDLIEGKIFDDTIAIGAYPIDIHNPDGKDIILEKVPAYGIPFRCLTPKHLLNVFVSGRCISATHEALASCRVMATCML